MFGDLYWIAAFSFLPKGIGGVFLWIIVYIIENSVNLHSECCFVLFLNTNHITILLQFSD